MGEAIKPRIETTRWSLSTELELIDMWEKEGLYHFSTSKEDQREIIAIDTPPPYPSGKWHVGGAAHYAQIDMIARYFRMKGFNVLVPFYADRNGLPVEVQIERTYKINAHEMAKTKEGRLKFLDLCRDFLNKTEKEMVNIWRRLGCSFTYWRDGTDSEEYRKVTQSTFIELFRRGLVYEAERPVNWCPRCKTTLADAELEHVNEETYLYYVKFFIEELNSYAAVATTRPELLKSCKALAFNPRDQRYNRFEGYHAVNPLYGHRMPILKHDIVDPDYGTGLVMVCSYGDHADVVMFRELKLEPLVIVDKNGILTSEAGPLAGLSVAEARRKAVELLESKNAIVKKERVTHSVPVCWRCKTPVQILHSSEWFLKQLEFKDKLVDVLKQISVKPEFHRVKVLDWINSVVTDWPISRDRYYATEIPVWRCRKCGSTIVPEPGKYYRPWIDPPPWDICPVCGSPSSELEGEKKVFDTWFDSSISVLYVSGYLKSNWLFERAFKNALRPQGIDIIRTWLYYTLLRVYQLTGKPAFKWIRLSGMGLDERGEAMHKSKGNVIDPDPILDRYGADAFRYWTAASAKLGYDYRYSEPMIKTGLMYVTKLWNIARFISSFPEPEEYELRPIDKSTLALLNKLVVAVVGGYRELDVYTPISELYQFTWNYFASHYLELVKTRAYNTTGKYGKLEQQGAWYTLHRVFKSMLVMLAPIMPFVTDAIYRALYEKSVHRERFPEPDARYPAEAADLAVSSQRANHALWKYKKERGMKLSDHISKKVFLPNYLRPVAEEMSDLHGLQQVEFYGENPPSNAVEVGGGVYIEAT
ncbi:MAG: valine--tRNA ligase [Desulfurococcaceae archaeon]